MSAATANPAVPDIVMERVEDQIAWYDKKSSNCQRNYERIKLTEIIAAALIPFVVGAHIPYAAWIAGGLGVLITILEGVLQLNTYQQIWNHLSCHVRGDEAREVHLPRQSRRVHDGGRSSRTAGGASRGPGLAGEHQMGVLASAGSEGQGQGWHITAKGL